MTQRQKDSLVEQITNQFEDRYFWPKLLESNLTCMTRWNDTDHQWAGIDFTLSSIAFDEKVKYHDCLNKSMMYLSFELEYTCRSGNRHVGWFLDPASKSDWYSIVQLSTNVPEGELGLSSHIDAADIIWCKKNEVEDFVQQHITLKRLAEVAEDAKLIADNFIKPEPKYGGIYTKDRKGVSRINWDHHQFWITYTPYLREQPVNLSLRTSSLLELKSTRHFIVTKQEVRKA